jgi:hypothetical protein
MSECVCVTWLWVSSFSVMVEVPEELMLILSIQLLIDLPTELSAMDPPLPDDQVHTCLLFSP